MKKIIPLAMTFVLTGLVGGIMEASPGNQGGHGGNTNQPTVTLLPEFRPIGGVSNNLAHPELDVIPNIPELAIAPLNFAPGTTNGLVDGPNPRTISNLIAGGTGANGVNAQTTDPIASAWLYVFGQFVDHDIDLEETPLDSLILASSCRTMTRCSLPEPASP